MKAFLAAGAIALSVLAGAAPASAAGISVSIRAPVGIRVIAAKPRCARPNTIDFKLAVKGIRFSRTTQSKRAAAGLGHVQVYLDQIPKDAYARRDLSHWVASLPGSSFALCWPMPILRGRRGKHTVYFTLGKTNSVLYRTKPARVTFRVR